VFDISVINMNRNSANKQDVFSYLRRQWDSSGSEETETDVGDRIWLRVQSAVRDGNVKAFRTRIKVAVAVAASFVAVALGGLALWKNEVKLSGETEYVWMASNGDVQILPDGTKVWMEEGCTMSFYGDFAERRQVWLKGNATFEVTRQEGRNFIVNLPNSYVEVKGTCFSIRQNTPSQVAVTLYNGKVDFVSKKTDNVITLKPSQNILYNTEDASILVSEFSKGICWSDGSYKMEKVNLEQLTEFLSAKYNVDFDCRSVQRSGKTLTGIIGHNESFEKVLEKICYVFDIDYRYENDVYSLID